MSENGIYSDQYSSEKKPHVPIYIFRQFMCTILKQIYKVNMETASWLVQHLYLLM